MASAAGRDALGAPALILVHGWMHSPRVWGPLVRELPGHWTSIGLALEGFGGRPWTRGGGGACLDRLARSLADQIVRTIQGTGSAICAGDSLGAIVLLRLALAGTLSAPLYLLGAPVFGLPVWLSLPGSAALCGPALRLLRVFPAPLGLAAIGLASRLTFAGAAQDRALLLSMARQADPTAARYTLAALQRLRVRPFALRRLSQPCRVVRGEHDRIVGPADAQRLAKILGACHEEIRGTGHTPMLEDPRALAASLVRFHAESVPTRD